MSRTEGSPWPRLTGWLAVSFGVLVAAGSVRQPGDATQAMQSTAFAVVAGCLLVAAGAALIAEKVPGRDLLVWAMPLGAVALAANHPWLLWTQDIPFTLLAFPLLALPMFFLSRPGAHATFGLSANGWRSRGGLNALACLVVYGALYAWVESSPVRSGGPDWPGFEHLAGGGGGFLGGMTAANEFVAKKATALVLLWHAVPAFLAVSIPAGSRSAARARIGTSVPGLAFSWVHACAAGVLFGVFVPQVVQPRSIFAGLAAAAGTGTILAVAQASVLGRVSGTRAIWWIAGTVVGGVGSGVATSLLIHASGLDFTTVNPGAAAFLLAGAAGAGVGQAIALRAKGAARIAWVPATLLAALGAWALTLLLVPFPRPEESLSPFLGGRMEMERLMREQLLLRTALRGTLLGLFTLPVLWRIFVRAAAPDEATRTSDPIPKEHAMPATRDEFPIMGFMKFYLVIHILAPLFMIGITIWAVNEPGLELTEWGPIILVGLGAWAVFDFYRLLKWSGFSVVVTGEGITVGKTTVAWPDVEGATVKTAFKLDTWIEIRPRSGEPLRIPAAVVKKDLLLTLVEKHHPEIVKK